MLGPAQQLWHFRQGDSFGLFNVPDMHAAVLHESDDSYALWITGNIGPYAGSVARLITRDFVTFHDGGPTSGRRAAPVFVPSCRSPTDESTAVPRGGGRGRGRPQPAAAHGSIRPASCVQNYDADYVGANAVLRASNGHDLLMFYEAGNKTAGSTTIEHGWEYNVIAIATSSDEGVTWKRGGVVLSGTDPKPGARTRIAQPGISEPGVIVADGYMYMFYQYIANESADGSPSVIQVARAPLGSNGAPGEWLKYFSGSASGPAAAGSFSEPGLGGKGSPIIDTKGSGCTRPVEVWPARSTYLNAYVLAFVCNEGWFLSTSTDLMHWSTPVAILNMPMFANCKPMDWNYVLITPGNPAGVIGRTGIVLYAHTDSKGTGCGGFAPHMLASRTFEFQLNGSARPPTVDRGHGG